MDEKVYEYTYTNDSNGNRVLDADSDYRRLVEYLERGNLYPMELDKKSLSIIYKKLASIITNYKEPKIFVYEDDIHKSIFASILMQLNEYENATRKDRARYMYYKVIDISYVTQQQISGEYHDPSLEFDNMVALFVKLNYTDVPNYLNAYCIRNLAEARKEKGLYTFFYFRGTVAEFSANKWKLDENGDGQRGVIRTDNNIIDTRSFIPLTRYIGLTDLNKILKAGGK